MDRRNYPRLRVITKDEPLERPVLTPFTVRYVILNYGYGKTERISFERYLEMRENRELRGCTQTIVEA